MSLLPSSVCCWWSPRQSDSWDTFPCRLHSAGAFTYRTGPCQVRRVSTVEGAQPAVRDVVAWCRVQPHAITWRSTIRDTVPATAPAFPAAHPTAQLLPRTLSGFLPSALCPPGGGRLTPSISAFAQPGTLTPGPLSEVALSPPGTQPLRAAGTVIHFANELTNKRYYRRMIFISLGKFSFIQITTNLILICPHYV